MDGDPTAWRIALERPVQPGVIALIDEIDAYQKPLYPPASHHGIGRGALLRPPDPLPIFMQPQLTR